MRPRPTYDHVTGPVGRLPEARRKLEVARFVGHRADVAYRRWREGYVVKITGTVLTLARLEGKRSTWALVLEPDSPTELARVITLSTLIGLEPV